MALDGTNILSSNLSDEQFARFGDFITGHLGIRMPEKKKDMLKSRLLRRLRSLDMRGFDEYFDYVFHGDGLEEELQEFINAVTTNKTEFFRESAHFDFLSSTVLPDLVERNRYDERNPIVVWCAGCSSGEEPYTLTMTIGEWARTRRGIPYRIVATDVSTKVLKVAAFGVYPEDRVDGISLEMKKRYLTRSRDRLRPTVRFNPETRGKILFRQLNFMNAEEYRIVPEPVDVIFFRNVMIYFDKETQCSILTRMAAKLAIGGYLFTGHAESIKDLGLPFRPVSNAVYQRIKI
jgi:chemotaxis protein methyltransferase CheR